MSRSAWMAGAVSSAYIAYMHYRKEIHAYIRCHPRRTKVGAILLVLLAGGMLAGVYLMKKDSADGRLLMWKVSVHAIAGQPWRGYGWDGVPGAYGQAQEDYFSAGNYTETEERVAGSPEYVFNEYLQVAMAWGVPVLLMALLVVGGSGYAGHRQKEYGLCGALLSLAVFSFSSYPFQFLLFVVALALLVTGCAIKTLSSRRPLVCMAGTVFLLLSAGYGCYRVYRWKEVRETASSAWHRKQMFYRSGAYEQAAEVYAEIYEDMKWNARYLFEYGHALHKLHRNEESNVVMKEALKVKDIQTPSWRHRDNILTPETAAELAERFRREKKVVGFTNGCFDLLHLGHLHSFMKAREACDVLFVGLNTDASIKRLKGEDRPINNEEMRSLLLASLDFVDYVVPFDEDTALPLIEKLRPDVIAKEGYPLECWPEGQFVKSYGGQALELPRLEGFSSTNIINRMKSSPE